MLTAIAVISATLAVVYVAVRLVKDFWSALESAEYDQDEFDLKEGGRHMK